MFTLCSYSLQDIRIGQMPRLAVILTQGFADWEYGVLCGLGRAYFGLDVRFVTPVPGDVISMGGLVARVSDGFELLDSWEPDAVVVIGGTLWEHPDAPDLSGLLEGAQARGAVLAGICGGTLALARAGVLNTLRHTSNDASFLGLHAAGYAGAALYVDQPKAVRDGKVVTAAGTAPVSFAAEIMTALDVPLETVQQLKSMLGAEHIGTQARSV
jgi:putative intracellular protease/amidase